MAMSVENVEAAAASGRCGRGLASRSDAIGDALGWVPRRTVYPKVYRCSYNGRPPRGR